MPTFKINFSGTVPWIMNNYERMAIKSISVANRIWEYTAEHATELFFPLSVRQRNDWTEFESKFIEPFYPITKLPST